MSALPRLEGEAAAWLAANREGLNRRFERASKRWPALEAERTLEQLARLLPPLAGPEPGAGELLSATFDLVLLHLGRDAFATCPGLGTLVGAAFPALRPLLLERPRVLPAALSNAVENLGAKGDPFAWGLIPLGSLAGSPERLLDAGALLAWQLGEARLRVAALAAAERLPGRAVLSALGLDGWPEAAVPVVLAGLRADAWTHPRQLLGEATLAALRSSPERAAELVERVAAPAAEAAARWAVVARVGAFAGFGGAFEAPPVVLDGGDRHTFFVRSGDVCFRLQADLFGWVCRPEPEVDLGVRKPARGGELIIGGVQVRVPGLEGAAAYTESDRVVAASSPDSYRISIATPSRAPL